MTTRYWEKSSTMEWYEFREVSPGNFEYTADGQSTWIPVPFHNSWLAIESFMINSGFIERPLNMYVVAPFTYLLCTVRRWENAANKEWKEYKETAPGFFEFANSHNNKWIASSAPNWTWIEYDMTSQGYVEVPNLAPSLSLPIGQGNQGLSPTFGQTVTSVNGYTTKYNPQVGDEVKVIGRISFSASALHGQVGKVTYVDPRGHYLNLDIEKNLFGNSGKGLHLSEVELHMTLSAPEGIQFIPIDFSIDLSIESPSIKRHKCHCDLTGPNCWLGCRCGGI